MKKALIGIDIGTSGAKIALVGEGGEMLASFSREYPILTAQVGYAEQNPEEWLLAVVEGVRSVMRQSGRCAEQVAGIGITGQMHSLVCVDAHINPIRPAILWADQRSAAIVQRLRNTHSAAQWAAWTKNPVSAGLTLPSWLWLQENEPETAAKTHYLLQPKDYVRYCMTGCLTTDPSEASATGFYDPVLNKPVSEILLMAGLSENNFPPLKPSLAIAGGLTREFAQRVGLLAETPVVVGGGDQAVQALAQGIWEADLASVTIGTGGQVFAPVNSVLYDEKLRVNFFTHVLPNRWFLLGATLSAGLSLRWFRGLFDEHFSYQELADMASTVRAAEDGLFFLPYLNGERTPWMDAERNAVWSGMRLGHTKAHLARAVMEGVVFSLRQCLDIVRELGAAPVSLFSAGGAARRPLWMQLQADIFGETVAYQNVPDATVIGAAFAAGLGVGLYADAESLKQAVIEKRETKWIEPTAASASYQQAYKNFLYLQEISKPEDCF